MSTKKLGSKDLEKRLGKLSVGEFLRSWRISSGLSQKQFARLIGISPANICDIEKGRKGVSPEKAHEIAKKIGYSPTVLVKMAIEELLADAGLKYAIEVTSAA